MRRARGSSGHCASRLVASRAARCRARARGTNCDPHRPGPSHRGFPPRDCGRAGVRARTRAHGAGEQLGLAHVPPRPCRGMGATGRRLLDPASSHRPHERVPAARGAGDPLPLRRHGERGTLRTAAVRSGARDPRRDLHRGATARIPVAGRSAERAPLRVVHARRARGNDVAERPRGRVAAIGGGGVPARRRLDRSDSRRSRDRAGASASS